MKIWSIFIISGLFVFTGAVIALAADERADSKMPEFVLPRVPPKSPAEALASFEVAAGFRIELVAAEPLVVDPVAMAFDEQGAMFVVEMRDYSEQDKERLGRVRRLTDEDGDGRFDRSTVYVDGLSWPTAVACYDGGVFIGNAPDILYCKDTDGDGVADERRVVFTGFGRGNVQGLLNSFQWGLDHRIHGATSSAGGTITRDVLEVAAADSDKAVSARLPYLRRSNCVDAILRSIRKRWRWRPRPAAASMGFASIGGATGLSAPTAIICKRLCLRSDTSRAIRFNRSSRRGDRSLPMARRRPCIGSARSKSGELRARSCASPGWCPARLKAVVSRPGTSRVRLASRCMKADCGERREVSGVGFQVSDPGRARSSSSSWVFVADVGSNLIHRKRLVPDGVTYRGERVDQETEFVRSRDIWFRPVQMAIGPEGGLYVADMYRETIEHPASLPPQLKRQLDLTSAGRGRIYRIVPSDYKYSKPVSLADANTEQLVNTLDHANMWQRTTALRLLYRATRCGRRRFVEGEGHGEQAAGRPYRRAPRAGRPQFVAAARLDRRFERSTSTSAAACVAPCRAVAELVAGACRQSAHTCR